MVERLQQALKIADTEGLIRDRALLEANLASARVSQAKLELAFTTFQRALQDAIDSNNRVLEADILIALASQAQLKGNNQESVDLISKALSISEHEGSLYEKSHALGELGKMMLLQGKAAQGAASIDEALQIDELNGYKFEAIHLVYRAIYLGLAGKVDQAMDSSSQARAKALAVRDPYSFIMAENTYAYALIRKGRTDEAIQDMSLLRRGELRNFTQDANDQVCVASSLELPIFHLTVLEDMANLLGAANQKERELETWQEIYEYSRDHNVLAGEAEAAQKVANLDLQLKKTDDALTHYRIAADLYRKLENEALARASRAFPICLAHTNRSRKGGNSARTRPCILTRTTTVYAVPNLLRTACLQKFISQLGIRNTHETHWRRRYPLFVQGHSMKNWTIVLCWKITSCLLMFTGRSKSQPTSWSP